MKELKTILFTLLVFVHSISVGASHKSERFVDFYNIQHDLVKATVYFPDSRQCDSTYWETADMSIIDTTNAISHKWIAVSQDLLKRNGGKYQYGDKVKIKGIGSLSGIYTVRDCMNKRFKNKIDILVGRQNKSLHFKSWNNVTIIKI